MADDMFRRLSKKYGTNSAMDAMSNIISQQRAVDFGSSPQQIFQTPFDQPQQVAQPTRQEIPEQSAPQQVAQPGQQSVAIPDGDGYESKLIQIESGGNPNAYNPSGATGLGQFMRGTAEPYLSKMGKTWDDYKGSADIQRNVLRKHIAYNKKALKGRGINPSNQNLWMAHNLGLGSAFNYHSGDKEVGNKLIRANLPKSAWSNPSEPTIMDYRQYWNNKWS